MESICSTYYVHDLNASAVLDELLISSESDAPNCYIESKDEKCWKQTLYKQFIYMIYTYSIIELRRLSIDTALNLFDLKFSPAIASYYAIKVLWLFENFLANIIDTYILLLTML